MDRRRAKLGNFQPPDLRRMQAALTLRVEDGVTGAGAGARGLRIRVRRGKTDKAGEGAEIGLPRGRHAETCPV